MPRSVDSTMPRSPAEAALVASRAAFARRLLAWYDTQRRDLPWRHTRDPYAIWLSETMLQQTQVATVRPYYARFLARFPTVLDLAAADLQEVLQMWAGLGYYRRARHLHAAARMVAGAHGGVMPRTAEGLAALPGVGRYTAGAVASIAYGQAAAVVDGNVMRVLARLACMEEDIAQPQVQQRFWALAGALVPAARAGDYNQALMELGATTCVPGRPACLCCPVREFCAAAAAGRQVALPVKSKRGATPEIRQLCVIIERPHGAGREVLLMQRPRGGLWEELWEFPALAAPAGLNSLRRLSDEVERQLGLPVRLARHCGQVVHQLTHRRMVYDVVQGALDVARAKEAAWATAPSGDYQAARWVALEGLAEQVPVARVTRKLAACAGLGLTASGGAAAEVP